VLASIAALITAVAALITSVGSIAGVLFFFRRISPKERKDAATGAAVKVLMPPHPILELAHTMVEEREKKESEAGDDGHGELRRSSK
jgi:hypothetical protein